MAIMQAASPEVLFAAESERPSVVASQATDVWALGVVAFEVRCTWFSGAACSSAGCSSC